MRTPVAVGLLVTVLAVACGTKHRSAGPTPERLHRVSGDQQRATVKTTLPLPLVVLVEAKDGTPSSGRVVTFSIVVGDARLSCEAAVTDSLGMASTRVALGDSIGTVRVTVAATGIDDAVEFTATAVAADGDTVLFFDDFTDDRGGWQQGPGTEGTWELDAAQGVYRVTVDGVSWAWVRVPATSYTIEARVRPGSWSSKVLWAGANVDENCQVDLLRDLDDTGTQGVRVLWTGGGDGVVKRLPVGPGPWYDLRVEIEGGTVTVYLDGVKVHDRIPTPGIVADGYVGIGSYGPTHHTEFDYVRVVK